MEGLFIVIVAGLITALVCGLGAVPLFFVERIRPRTTVVLWGLACGVMLFASFFGFIVEGLEEGTLWEVGIGALVGVLLVLVVDRLIDDHQFAPQDISEADFKKLAIIVGVLTLHSFPEGVALGVSFADLGTEGDLVIAGLAIPALAIFITVAVSIQNIPEGLAVAIPLKTYGVSHAKIFWVAVLTSIPQPIGAAIAFLFVTFARQVLPYGFGFAAGAMAFLVFYHLIPDALETADEAGLARRGLLPLALGAAIGVALMTPIMLLTE